MSTTLEDRMITLSDRALQILHELRFGAHRLGYRHLLFLIPIYALDHSQSLTKELYPRAARHFGYSSWRPVERAVRTAILAAWQQQDRAIWDQYFPGTAAPPSNKQFIAAVAEEIKMNTPGRNRQFDRASPTLLPLKSYTLSTGPTPFV